MRWPWTSSPKPCAGCDARDLELGRAHEREAYLSKRVEDLETKALEVSKDALDKLSAHADLKAHLAEERLKLRPADNGEKPQIAPTRRITPYIQSLIGNRHLDMRNVRTQLRRKPAPMSRVPPVDPETVKGP